MVIKGSSANNLVIRIIAIGFIWLMATVAWSILGGSIVSRTESTDRNLRHKVEGLWGSKLEQSAPYLWTSTLHTQKITDDDGEEKTKIIERTEKYLPVSTEAQAELWSDPRRKGLLWYNTYRIEFSGLYQLPPPAPGVSRAEIRVNLPATNANYDKLVFRLNGKDYEPRTVDNQLQLTLKAPWPEKLKLEFGYATQGMDTWHYAFDPTGVARVRNFKLSLLAHFDGFDFPEDAMSPTRKKAKGDGWRLFWDYDNLMADSRIGFQVPHKLNPGPIVSRITFFAPIGLLFFFFVVFFITLLKNIPIHPMNYFFLAAAFFSFHLLFAYLVDHIDVHLAFAIASVVSLILTISYLRLAVGVRFALVESGIAQMVYLILFSYAFFWKGYTGLTVTIGAIATLFIMMQLTGRVDWNEVFASGKKAENTNH